MAPTTNTSRHGCGCGTMLLGCLGGIVLLVVVLVAAGVFAWWQWTSTPNYWDEHRARIAQLTPAERDRHAEAVEHRLSRWLSQANDADPQRNYVADSQADAQADSSDDAEPDADSHTLNMSFDEVNAWLDRRLDAWLQQQEIDFNVPVRDMIVTSEDGKLVVAGAVPVRQSEQVVSAVIDAVLLPDGDLRLHVDRVRVGRFPLPNETVVRYAREHLPEGKHTAELKRALQVFEGTTITPVRRIDNTREVRLTAWSVNDEGVELTIKMTPLDETN